MKPVNKALSKFVRISDFMLERVKKVEEEKGGNENATLEQVVNDITDYLDTVVKWDQYPVLIRGMLEKYDRQVIHAVVTAALYYGLHELERLDKKARA